MDRNGNRTARDRHHLLELERLPGLLLLGRSGIGQSIEFLLVDLGLALVKQSIGQWERGDTIGHLPEHMERDEALLFGAGRRAGDHADAHLLRADDRRSGRDVLQRLGELQKAWMVFVWGLGTLAQFYLLKLDR